MRKAPKKTPVLTYRMADGTPYSTMEEVIEYVNNHLDRFPPSALRIIGDMIKSLPPEKENT